MTEKGTHSLPMLPSLCPAPTGDCLTPFSWTRGSYMQRHTGTHSSMQPHTCSNPTAKQMCPSTNVQTWAQGPQVHSPFRQHVHLHTSFPPLPFHFYPSPAAAGNSVPSLSPPLVALCCSDTGFNKFALVMTSRMWPWGGECPAAPDCTCLYVNHEHSLRQTLGTTFLPLPQPWSEAGGSGPTPER